ncbi:MAG: DinB family protein [Ardenticatenaceae bacterium]|nr:DinB family protein [Ardenticatenaceae bacterium]
MNVMTLLQELREARRELLAAVEGLRPSEALTEKEWTVHDLLGHIAAWDREVLAALQERQAGRDRYELEGYQDDDRWNAVVRARKAELAPEQVRMDFLMIRREVEDLLRETYSEVGATTAPIHVSWLGDTTVDELVRSTSITHDREHAAQVRAWRESRRPL